jgi:hypothetical protein
MYFPPVFFDISVYFTTHLIKEIKLLGPVFLHQMYAYERFNDILKSFIRNHISDTGVPAGNQIGDASNHVSPTTL